MKRKGHIYERVATWEMVKRAQIESSKSKPNSYGVQKHKKNWLKELVELHEKALAGTMRTGDYVFESVVSGQDKVRFISKGGNNIDIEVTDIMQIDGSDVEKDKDGQIIFTHNKQKAI